MGELLLQRGLVEWEPLALAIGDQPASGMRLCSLLVRRGLLDFDQASRILGEIHGSAAALRRHLEGRDESLADLLPDDVANENIALPIGRLANGTLIVCVRDPSPALQAKLSRVLREDVVLAVAPALYIERLVAAIYAPRELDSDELEEAVEQVSGELDLPIDVDEPLEITIDIDDTAVKPRARRRSKPSKPPKKRALSVVVPTLAVTPLAAPTRDALDATLASFREIDEVEWLFDVAMQYLSKHWTASLLVALRDKRAVGLRGHGARITQTAVKTLVVDIADIALLELARTKRQTLVDEKPTDPGPEFETLVKMLGTRTPITVPLSRGDTVTHVLFLADPIGKDRDDALVDLGLLTESMGEALARM
ncbi:MAG TPA: hypothetical protein VL326_02190 [Kofleriaceae bacterium]|nr:hypothetical protein [Kofleriaceae bacterium]